MLVGHLPKELLSPPPIRVYFLCRVILVPVRAALPMLNYRPSTLVEIYIGHHFWVLHFLVGVVLNFYLEPA